MPKSPPHPPVRARYAGPRLNADGTAKTAAEIHAEAMQRAAEPLLLAKHSLAGAPPASVKTDDNIAGVAAAPDPT